MPDANSPESRAPESDLILGLAAGLHYGDVRPFAASLERTGFAGTCLLFVSATTRDLERIESHGVRCVPFERPADMAHVPFNAWRYFLYLEHLRSSDPGSHGRVLLTDVRDVVFQADPFALEWAPNWAPNWAPDLARDWPGEHNLTLNLALEDRRMTVDQCPYMEAWVRGHLGDAPFEAMAGKPISCSGTTLGTRPAITAYLERLTALLLPFDPPSGPRGMAGYDQGVHNHLLHAGLLNDLGPALHDNSGPILTLGYRPSPPVVNEQGDILNDVGVPAIMVHQYDRHPDLHRSVRARYVPKG